MCFYFWNKRHSISFSLGLPISKYSLTSWTKIGRCHASVIETFHKKLEGYRVHALINFPFRSQYFLIKTDLYFPICINRLDEDLRRSRFLKLFLLDPVHHQNPFFRWQIYLFRIYSFENVACSCSFQVIWFSESSIQDPIWRSPFPDFVSNDWLISFFSTLFHQNN